MIFLQKYVRIFRLTNVQMIILFYTQIMIQISVIKIVKILAQKIFMVIIIFVMKNAINLFFILKIILASMVINVQTDIIISRKNFIVLKNVKVIYIMLKKKKKISIMKNILNLNVIRLVLC